MRTSKITLSLFTIALAGACVDHRPIRNGLRDEHVYLTKSDLTGPNPKMTEKTTNDYGWLFKSTVVKASSPNVLGDWAFPGFESDTKYVRFQFKESKLQVIDAWKLQNDNAEDPNDDLATSTDRVMLEFDGEHVDTKLRDAGRILVADTHHVADTQTGCDRDVETAHRHRGVAIQVARLQIAMPNHVVPLAVVFAAGRRDGLDCVGAVLD